MEEKREFRGYCPLHSIAAKTTVECSPICAWFDSHHDIIGDGCVLASIAASLNLIALTMDEAAEEDEEEDYDENDWCY